MTGAEGRTIIVPPGPVTTVIPGGAVTGADEPAQRALQRK
jgi:hypothetical protein